MTILIPKLWREVIRISMNVSLLCLNLTTLVRLYLSILFLVGTAYACSIASAQDKSSESELPSAKFQKIISALAISNKLTIIAEGAPITFDEAKLREVSYAQATPTRKISIVANAADYDVRNSRGVFLLTKRYSDPRDIPCVTVSECRTSMKAVATLLSSFLSKPGVEGGDPYEWRIRSFFLSLSPEQINAMKKTPIPLTRLTASQKNKAVAMLASTYLDDINATAIDTARALDSLPKASLRKEVMNGATFIVWSEPSRPRVTGVLGGGGGGRRQETTPSKSDVALIEAQTTMSAEVSRINERMTDDKLTIYEIDADFADKPLTVAGMENLNSQQAAFALASVYDLRIRNTGSVHKVTNRPRPTMVSIDKVQEEILKALPVAVARILTNDTPDKYVPEEEREMLVANGATRDFVKKRTVVLYADEAVRRIRQNHERELDKVAGKGIPFARLGPSDRRAVAVAQMGDFLRVSASMLNTPLPRYIAQLDNLYFTGERYTDSEDGKSKIKIEILLPDANREGSYTVLAGFDNVGDSE